MVKPLLYVTTMCPLFFFNYDKTTFHSPFAPRFPAYKILLDIVFRYQNVLVDNFLFDVVHQL